MVVSEAMPVGVDEEFGDDRITEVAAKNMQESVAEIVRAVNEAVTAFPHGAPPADDVTVVVASAFGYLRAID